MGRLTRYHADTGTLCVCVRQRSPAGVLQGSDGFINHVCLKPAGAVKEPTVHGNEQEQTECTNVNFVPLDVGLNPEHRLVPLDDRKGRDGEAGSTNLLGTDTPDSRSSCLYDQRAICSVLLKFPWNLWPPTAVV